MISNNDIYDRIGSSEKALINAINSATLILKSDIALSAMQQTIESQQRTIEQLTNILAHKYEHGFLFADAPGEKTLIIRDGNIVSVDKATSISFNWDCCSDPTLSIEYNV